MLRESLFINRNRLILRMAKQTTDSGLGLSGTVFIVFLILKLTDVIDWSWWWVTSPLWIGFAILLSIALIALPFLIIDRYKNRKRW